MKICTKCGKRKKESCFKKKKSKMCRNGYYISGACRDCENKEAREYCKKKRKEDPVFAQNARDRIKKYQQSDKGKANKKQQHIKYRGRHRKHYLAHSKEYYQRRLKRLKKEIAELKDDYIITQLQNPHRKIKYTRAYLKEHPELIELARTRILQHRIKKKLEEFGMGICRRCKKQVAMSEFRKQRATDKKKEHIVRLCSSCQKEVSKENWSKYKNDGKSSRKNDKEG